MFIAPSVTPWRVPLDYNDKTPPHNPGFRSIEFDADTYELKDYQQYVLDLSRVRCIPIIDSMNVHLIIKFYAFYFDG